MSGYQVTRLEDIDELTDGREPWRPVRHHFGITSFGVNAWTGHTAGDRILNEHDEGEEDSDEELYYVQQGRARFELDGETVDAPAGTLVFVRAGVRRTAFAEEPETTIIAFGGVPGQAYQADGWEVSGPLNRLYYAGEYAKAADCGLELLDAYPQYPTIAYNLACSPAGRRMRSSTCAYRSKARNAAVRLRPATRTSTRSARSPRSRSSSARPVRSLAADQTEPADSSRELHERIRPRCVTPRAFHRLEPALWMQAAQRLEERRRLAPLVDDLVRVAPPEL